MCIEPRNAGHDSRLFESDGSVRLITSFLRGEPIEAGEVVLPPIGFQPIDAQVR